jgi:hypothetical protein
VPHILEGAHNMPIVRTSEVVVVSDKRAEFLDALTALVADFPARYPGLERHEILVDLEDPCRVRYVSQWRDEGALVEFAGPGWRTDPVTFPGERELLVGGMTLRHFVPLDTP